MQHLSHMSLCVCVCVNENMTQQQSAVNCIVCAPCIPPQPLIIFTFFTPHIWSRRQRLMRAASAPSGCGAVIFLLRESRREKKGGVRGERGKESERGCRCSKKPAAEKWQGLREREMKEYKYGERRGLISREKSEGVEMNRWWDWKLRAITENEGGDEFLLSFRTYLCFFMFTVAVESGVTSVGFALCKNVTWEHTNNREFLWERERERKEEKGGCVGRASEGEGVS